MVKKGNIEKEKNSRLIRKIRGVYLRRATILDTDMKNMYEINLDFITLT